MSKTNRPAPDYTGLAICASLKTGAVKLHRATCSSVRPSSSMYVFTTDIADHVASAGENGTKVTRCACCKVAK